MERTIQPNVPTDFSTVMRERTAVLLNLSRLNLNSDWVHTYELQQLAACCKRMDAVLSGATPPQSALQRELIANKTFAVYYEELMKRFPEDTAPENSVAASERRKSNNAGYVRYEPSRPRSRHAVVTDRFVTLLENCQDAGMNITDYPQADVMATLELEALMDGCRLVYLKQFAPMRLSGEEQEVVIRSLNSCISVPLELNDVQRTMLRKPFVGSCKLFSSTPFAEACSLLTRYPDLEMIARFLYEMDIRECLKLDQYKLFAQNAAEYSKRLISVLGGLEADTAGAFMEYWQRSGCPLRELQTMERRLASDMMADLGTIFTNYTGYVNLLYGNRFKKIDLASSSGWQEKILLYAIISNKKHFIRLVDDDPSFFLLCPPIRSSRMRIYTEITSISMNCQKRTWRTARGWSDTGSTMSFSCPEGSIPSRRFVCCTMLMPDMPHSIIA